MRLIETIALLLGLYLFAAGSMTLAAVAGGHVLNTPPPPQPIIYPVNCQEVY